jgi:hypothetical protein
MPLETCRCGLNWWMPLERFDLLDANGDTQVWFELVASIHCHMLDGVGEIIMVCVLCV